MNTRAKQNTVAFVLAGAAGIALACHNNPSPSCGTPGWVWGGRNCGLVPPSTSTNRAECRDCCQNGVNFGDITAFEQLDCNAFCDQANFGPYNSAPGFWSGLGRIWLLF